jgi:hypothetical protein
LSAFERRYWGIVGVRYATLDAIKAEIEAGIAVLSARHDPSNRLSRGFKKAYNGIDSERFL